MTDVLVVDARVPEPALVARAAACLRAGGLVAFPTETVYGLGAHAADPNAVQRLFAAKGRPPTDPLIVHVASLDSLTTVVASVPPAAVLLAQRFWPGPLTLVLPRSLAVPSEVTAGLGTVGVRIPSHPVALALIRAAGVPVAAPSANLFSRPSPTTAAHVLQDLDGRIDMVVDGGPTVVGIESTVLDLSGEIPIVLRPGAVTLAMLRDVLPETVAREGSVAPDGGAMPSPGMLTRHYAPRAPLTLYESRRDDSMVARMLADARALVHTGQRVGILAADEDRAAFDTEPGLRVTCLGSIARIEAVAARLYAALRAFDEASVDVILARGFPADTGFGTAVQDRLRRASSGRIVHVSTDSSADRRSR